MNDKQQLAAMGEQLTAMGERMGVQVQPLCMAKRIEELEAQVRVMAELLQKARKYVTALGKPDDEVSAVQMTVSRIDALLAGQVPAPAVPEGWQLVPVEPTQEMILAGVAAQAEKLKRYALGGSLHPIDHGMPDAYSDMIAAAPSPGDDK